MYNQGQSPLYDIEQTDIAIEGGDITVRYVEMAGEGHMEFAHSHTDHEIYYCVAGRMQIKMQGTTHHLSAGDFALIAPGVIHEIRYDPAEPKQYFIFVFRPVARGDGESRFFEAFAALFEQHAYFVGRDRKGVDELFGRLLREREEDGFAGKEMLRNYYLEFIVRILRNLIEKKGTDNANTNLAMQITKYLHENYDRNISMQDVADALYVTPRHINRVYREFFGSSFKQTLQNFRVNYAKNYLCDTNDSIEKIARMVGFSSAHGFSRLFLELEGMSATEYRQRHHRPAEEDGG